jgi:predicted ATPase
MLTRLKVNGFKNLVDVDVRFGPFTCIAGANGVGKSNLFDAIRFLSALSDRPLIDAALSVRDEGGRSTDIRSIFHRIGDDYVKKMTFEAEMIVPREGHDDLGQRAEASITFLRYRLVLGYRIHETLRSFGGLEILEESLVKINTRDASKHLLFQHTDEWLKSAVHGTRGSAYISTEDKPEGRVINLHQDGGSSGRPQQRLAANLPRTILSATNAAESPTALLARREMQSWRLLQLEPSALRKPDNFNAPTKLGDDGSHLAATLYELARTHINPELGENDPDQIYTRIANRLYDLIEDVYKIQVDRDDRRELLTLQVTDRNNTTYAARSLSDGTLRFLALAVLEMDTSDQGVICLEEPENGIHPRRVPEILKLLTSIATDTAEAISTDNPLRQVIINTHSPVVVQQVADDSLLIAELVEDASETGKFKRVQFSCLSDTWRDTKSPEPVTTASKSDLMAYLNPVSKTYEEIGFIDAELPKKRRRVIDRTDLTMPLPLVFEE